MFSVPMWKKTYLVEGGGKLLKLIKSLKVFDFCNLFQAFGTGLYKVLKLISDFDPAGLHCMNKSYVGKRGWVFEFNKLTFFITTFAPFYPSMHPRYSFGADSCYILFQPELSFAFHDLPPDTTETKWEGPESVRDKIRVAFKEAGRPYSVPESVSSPMALEMLRPISEEEEVFEWWKQQDLWWTDTERLAEPLQVFLKEKQKAHWRQRNLLVHKKISQVSNSV